MLRYVTIELGVELVRSFFMDFITVASFFLTLRAVFDFMCMFTTCTSAVCMRFFSTLYYFTMRVYFATIFNSLLQDWYVATLSVFP